MRVLVFCSVVLFALALWLVVRPVFAWDCVAGAEDTPENQAKGLCVEHGTPVPTPTSVATATPQPTTPPKAPPTPATSTPVVMQVLQSSSSREQYCHYEPSTGLWEIRWTTNTTLPGERPLANGECDQHPTPTLVPTSTSTATVVPPTLTSLPTATATATATSVPTATPSPLPTMAPAAPAPPVEEVPPAPIVVPVQVPR